jgi:hypothetical protein
LVPVPSRRAPRSLVLLTALAIALGGCRATGRTANDYFDWGGRTFTTNPGSILPYFIGFGAFFVAGLPLDLFSLVATAIGWPEGAGEDYQGSALAPSLFLGTTGGLLLGAPFFPLGLPWWEPDRDDSEAPPAKAAALTPADGTSTKAENPNDPDTAPAGAPRR